ncbi:MAG: hypothetical protein K2K29_01055 [Muribaculaceae bacterium]|nr:hypothetical protein [Muribaculaceae bacterium]
MSVSLFAACHDEPHSELLFIGDSIVSRWDLDEAFPTITTYNRGIGGSGIKYLEESEGCGADKTIVVLSGTNDISTRLKNNESAIKDYTARYISALRNLNADKIFVISVLPREYGGDATFLPTIEMFNSHLEAAISDIDNIRFVNVYRYFLCGETIDYDLFEDNLHLTPQGYQILNLHLRKALKNEGF